MCYREMSLAKGSSYFVWEYVFFGLLGGGFFQNSESEGDKNINCSVCKVKE